LEASGNVGTPACAIGCGGFQFFAAKGLSTNSRAPTRPPEAAQLAEVGIAASISNECVWQRKKASGALRCADVRYHVRST
jgi:hypothetical protein